MSLSVLLGKRQTHRAAINPLDKSTIVSIFPKNIHEVKPTLQPSVYDIPAGTYEKPSITVVGSASWWREIDPEQPLIEIPTSSILVAESIITDWANGLLLCNMSDTMPGLFFIPGEHTLDAIKKNYQKLLDRAKDNQNRWYQALVRLGDVMWARTNGNPISIPEDARLAAKTLGLSKDWIADSMSYELIKCVACGQLRNPAYPICQWCKAIIDPVKAKELNLTFAS